MGISIEKIPEERLDCNKEGLNVRNDAITNNNRLFFY